MSLPTDSVAPAPPTGTSNPWSLVQWWKRICDWIAALSPSGASEYDTGWVAVPPITDYSGSPQVRRVGRLVHLRGSVSPTAGNLASGVAVSVATVPDGYRPPSGIVGACGFGGTNVGAYAINASTGVVTVRPSAAATFVDLSAVSPYLID